MTAPANSTKPATQQNGGKGRRDSETDAGSAPQEADTASRTDRFADLVEAQEDAIEQAQQLVAVEVLTDARNRSPIGQERADQLRLSAREELLAELRSQEQEQARRQLAQATRSGEDAVAGLVEGIAVFVRGMVPAALLRPEDLIESGYALADQGLRVTRRLALTVAGSARSLTAGERGRTA